MAKLRKYHFPFFGKKKNIIIYIFWSFAIKNKKKLSGFGWTGELWSNRIFLILGNQKFIFLFGKKKFFLKNFRFFEEDKSYFWRLFETFGFFLDFLFSFLYIYIYFFLFVFKESFGIFCKVNKVTNKHHGGSNWTPKMA